MKRIFLFIVTNLAVMLVLSVSLKLLGLDRVLAGAGFNVTATLVMAAIIGFGGALFSLAISKWSAKMMTGARVITVPSDQGERWLVDTVQRQAQAAGIGMPEVAIYDAPDVNAFATGMNRNNALVAVSTGLLNNMTREEAEAVLGHEVSHVANGDMVTLALIQGVVNTFVIFLSRVVGYVVDRMILKNERGYGIGYYVSTIVAELVLGILASIIVMWFSRRREFRADSGGAKLAGREKMVAALQRLQAVHEAPSTLPAQMKAFGVNGGGGGLSRLFMTHPPLEERIAALRAGAQPIANEWGR
jgi:heat shock protein HtpX